jgi:hypothetical protein
MPEINSSKYSRERSVEFRRLAKARDKAGHRKSSAMLSEIAAEFEAETAELEGKSDV